MPRLDDMRVFAHLAQAGSVSGAARSLGIPKQTVSRRLARLEEDLGVELARRTTRTVALTDVGRAYAARCADVVRLADEANRAAASQIDAVVGTLRITADHSFGEAFLPGVVTEFIGRHPDVAVEVMLTSRKVDLLEEGFDVAFRVGPAPDVTYLAATRLGPARLWTVASAEYLARRGTPETPDDLAAHDCLSAVPSRSRTGWPLAIAGALRIVDVDARVRVNGLAMARHAARAGAGVAHLPEFAVRDDVARGDLVRVLEASTPDVGGVHIVYPHTALLAPKVREFVEAARARFGSVLDGSGPKAKSSASVR